MDNVIIVLKNIYVLSMFIFRMVFRFFLAFSFVIIIIFGTFCFTNKGFSFIWNQIKNNVKGLSGELIDGHLGRGFSFKKLSYNSSSFNFEASSLHLSYDFIDLLKGELNFENIQAKDVLIVVGGKPQDLPLLADFLLKRLSDVGSYSVDPKTKDLLQHSKPKEDDTLKYRPIIAQSEPEVEPDTPSKDEYLNFPIKITANKIEVNHFLLMTEYVDVAVGEFISRAEVFADTVKVYQSEVSFIDVRLHNDSEPEQIVVLDATPSQNSSTNTVQNKRDVEDKNTASSEDENAKSNVILEKELAEYLKDPFNEKIKQKYIEQLPHVFIPINVYVEQLSINNVKYHQDGYSTGVMAGVLSGKVNGSLISVDKLFVTHSLGQATLYDGTMTLDKYYPIDAKLHAFSHNTEWFDFLNNHTIDIKAKGDLADIKGSISLKGIVDLDANVQLSPIGPQLPFKADLVAKNLSYPLLQPDYKINTLNLNTRGSLLRIASDISASDIYALNYPAFSLNANLENTFEDAIIKNLEINSNKDNVSLKGLVSWAKAYSFNGEVKANVENTLRYHLPTSAAANLHLKSDVYFKDVSDWRAHIESLNVNGNLRGYPLEILTSNLQADSSGKYLLDKFYLYATKDNILDIHGSLNETANFEGKIDLKNLAVFDKNLEGEVIGGFKINGNVKSPVIALNLSSKMLSYADYILDGISLNADVKTKDLKVSDSDILLKLGLLRENKEQLTKNFDLKISGSESDHKVNIKGDVLKSPVKLDLNGSLSQSRTNYQGSINKLYYAYPDISITLLKTLDFNYTDKGEFIIKPHSWSVARNVINFEKIYYAKDFVNVVLNAKDFRPMRFRKLLPKKLYLKSSFDIDGDIKLVSNKLQGNVNVHSKNGAIFYEQKGQNYKDIKFSLDMLDNQVKSLLELDLAEDGVLKLAPIVNNPLASSPTIGGELKIHDFDLEILNKFVPDISNSSGKLNADGTFGGNFEKPEFFGKITIDKMSIITVTDIGMIDNINTQMNFYGTKGDLNTDFTINQKKGKITGDVSWHPDVKANININTDEIPINLMGYGSGKIKLDVNGKFGDEINEINGSVLLPEAQITVKNLPESSVSTSSDVVEIRRDNTGSFNIKKESTLPIAINLLLKIEPKVSVAAMGLRTGLEGTLKVAQKPYQSLTINGTVNLIDGRFKAYGQNLIIEKGRFSFVGDPANPNIEVRAIRDPRAMEDENVTVGVLVRGSANYPNISLFSRPSMSQTETLSYLLRGKPLGVSKDSNSDMSTSLLLGVGLMQTSNVVGKLGEKVGIEDVSFDSRGDGDETSVEVSAYILPKVQVSYGYGIYNAISEFRIRYEMFPRFYIEGVSSVEQAVDALYKFEF